MMFIMEWSIWVDIVICIKYLGVELKYSNIIFLWIVYFSCKNQSSQSLLNIEY